MSRLSSPDAPEDLLASIRRIVSEETAVQTPSARRSDSRLEKIDEPGSHSFVDRISGRLAFPSSVDASAMRFRQTGFGIQGPEKAPPSLPEAEAEAKPNKLLLTSDFQVRAPEPSRVPHPLAADAAEAYDEDSDLLLSAEDAPSVPEISAALKDAVSSSVRAALRAEVALEGQETTADAPSDVLVDEDGFIDANTLRDLVTAIVHEELRGDLGAQISRRVRKLVRTEINRTLQVRALE